MRRALEPEEFELYDLQTDPDEKYNLFGKVGYEQLTSHLKDRLIALRKETSDTFECRPTGLPLHPTLTGAAALAGQQQK